MQESTKSMKIIAWCLLTPIVLFLLMAGGTKIAGINPLSSIDTMSRWVIWIGFAEVSAALLFLIPRTSILCAFALSAHLGGAILFHILRGENLYDASIFTSFWFQSTLLLGVWLVVVLRYPAILTNFKPVD